MLSRRAIGFIRRFTRTADRISRAFDSPGSENRIVRRTDFTRCERPVLLLHGFMTGRRSLEVLERRLRRDGFGPFSLDLGGLARSLNTRGIDDLADLVCSKVERLYARYPDLGPLSIVGHSKGGLVAAYYVKRMGGWRRTRAVVTLGTPHDGTPKAWLGLPIAMVAHSVLQMIPGSPFLGRLREGAWPAQVRLASIWSREDRWATYPSAVIDTMGLPQLANIEVHSSHAGLLTSQRVYRAVAEELRLAEKRAPVVRGGLTGLEGGRTEEPTVAPEAEDEVGTDVA